jgi:hypothetical protein
MQNGETEYPNDNRDSLFPSFHSCEKYLNHRYHSLQLLNDHNNFEITSFPISQTFYNQKIRRNAITDRITSVAFMLPSTSLHKKSAHLSLVAVQ